jgi:hypothetical protein
MGIPIQPAPYCDPYLSQISKSNLVLNQFKQRNLKDTRLEEGIAIKAIRKWANNMFAAENFVNSV